MLKWALVFISAMSPTLDQKVIGYFPDYETCHKEHVYLVENSSYFKYWSCVQLPITDDKLTAIMKEKANETQTLRNKAQAVLQQQARH